MCAEKGVVACKIVLTNLQQKSFKQMQTCACNDLKVDVIHAAMFLTLDKSRLVVDGEDSHDQLGFSTHYHICK